ncbi:MAG: flagellar basal body P-ring protein FlgI [Planctomycetota bacterium]
MNRNVLWLFVFVAAALTGCGAKPTAETAPRSTAARDPELARLAAVLEGTVSQYAYLEAGGAQVVRGYGLVVGLGANGSSECPTEVRKRLVEQMAGLGVGDARTGTRDLSPNRLIDDPDTAVVLVSAVIDPGTPKGAPLDVSVRALPRSQTLSLEGGILFRTELRAFNVDSGTMSESRVLAEAQGPVFVNPFAPDRDPTMSARLRQGRVIGGGRMMEGRKIELVLRQPDYRIARVLQEAINSAYPDYPKVANARTPALVDITIPRQFRNDWSGFLQQLMHLYVRRGGGIQDRKARELVEAIAEPGAPHETISLIWEVMGRQVLPLVREVYASETYETAYYAARAGARLGDAAAVEVLVAHARGESRHRLEAIAELGTAGTFLAEDTLRALLNDPDALVRIAAYEALEAGRLAGGVERIGVEEKFSLHIVPSDAEPMIYATRTRRPRIVLFGEGMLVRRPIFFTTPDQLVTINANHESDLLEVYRRVGAQERLSETLTIAPDLKTLILTLGRTPEPDVHGHCESLGLTYSQVVSVLYRLCESESGKQVRAEFVLQSPDRIDTIDPGQMPRGRQAVSSRLP